MLMAWISTGESFSETFWFWWEMFHNISQLQQNELKTKKPIPQTKTNLPKGYRVLSQEMKGNARTLGYLGIDLLEKLILCIVSYGWFKWLSLNISWLYVVILHVYHM